jgi:CRP-like cAMP-binding protein
MGNTKNKTGKRRRKRHGFANQTKALAASALAAKVGYLQVKDFSDAKLFDNLLTRSYGPHKVIRCKDNELLLVTRGVVEVWHQQRDTLVKTLVIGTLFGKMPLLGQTMVVTQAISGEAGAMVAAMNEEQVSQLIKADPIAIARQLYPRLAAAEADHYRARFQQVGPRLAALILNLAGKGTSIEGLTQREMGEKTGVLRETASVALADMKAKKLIAIKRKEIIILDRKALEELSQM